MDFKGFFIIPPSPNSKNARWGLRGVNAEYGSMFNSNHVRSELCRPMRTTQDTRLTLSDPQKAIAVIIFNVVITIHSYQSRYGDADSVGGI